MLPANELHAFVEVRQILLKIVCRPRRRPRSRKRQMVSVKRNAKRIEDLDKYDDDISGGCISPANYRHG